MPHRTDYATLAALLHLPPPPQDFYAELIAYAAANGGATRVPTTGATTQLARWVHEQRGRHKQGTLPAERGMLLEQLPSWEWRE